MYSHKQTSPISSRPGTSRLMARAAFCTMPSSAQAPVAMSSLVSGSPNRITLGMPSALHLGALLYCFVDGEVEDSGHRTHFLAHAFSRDRQTADRRNLRELRRVSRTNERIASLRRRRRGRSIGNAMTENSSTRGVVDKPLKMRVKRVSADCDGDH